jgi:hypothetical protein
MKETYCKQTLLEYYLGALRVLGESKTIGSIGVHLGSSAVS